MHHRLARFAFILALIPGVALAADLAAAPGPDVHFVGADGNVQRGVRCAAPTPTEAEIAAIAAAIADHDAVFGRWSESPTGTVSIPVRWHVVRSGTLASWRWKGTCSGGSGVSPRIRSAAFSATIIVGA